MLHQVVVSKKTDQFKITYEIFNRKPKSLHSKLAMLCRYHKILNNKMSRDCEICDTSESYQITGSFHMTAVEFDYTDASEPSTILERLKTAESKNVINDILSCAGEKGCNRKNKR